MLITKWQLSLARKYWGVLQNNSNDEKKGYINFSSGNPIASPFPAAANAAQQALNHHLTSRYLGPGGSTRARNSLLPFCDSLGLFPTDQYLTKDNLLPSMGSTHLYSCVIEILAKRAKVDHPGKTPVLLMPAPTYGVFATQPDMFGFEIETLPLKRENDWHANPDELECLISKINNSPDRFVAAYYRVNPSNPMGAVEDIDVTGKISNILAKNNVFFIDDLAYFGLSDQNDIATLARYNFDYGVTFFSLSKAFCLPGLRSGFMCGPKWVVSEAVGMIERTVISVPLPSVVALTGAFAEENRQTRVDFFNINRFEYQKHFQLLSVLVYGMEAIRSVTPARQQEIESLVCKVFANAKEAKDILENGMPQIEIVNDNMTAGYFAVLGLRKPEPLHYGTQRLTDSFHLAAVIVKQQNVLALPMALTLAEGDVAQGIRISFGLSEEKIVRGIRGIYRALKLLSDEPNPHLQRHIEDQGMLIPAELRGMGI